MFREWFFTVRDLFHEVRTLRKEIHHMAGELEALNVAVAANTVAVTAAVAKLATLTVGGVDPVAVQSAADIVTANNTALNAAVASHGA